MSPVQRVLLSRLLTRIGDQAWNFAVPIVVVGLGPGGLRTAAVYAFGRSLGMVLLMPRLARLIDRWPRLNTALFGTTLQAGGVLIAGALIGGASPNYASGAWLGALVCGGLAAALGATLMEIAVASDLIPALVAPSELARVNSRLKQIDLATEVGVPVAAGLLLALRVDAVPMLGFSLIALFNLMSFLPEYLLLATVFVDRHDLAIAAPLAPSLRLPLRSRLSLGWRTFVGQPARGSMLAFACLWFTVLSPHGTLLTGFLKQGWQVPEAALGIFRGLGALFGLGATIVWPHLVRRRGLVGAARQMILFQAAALVVALGAFFSEMPLLFLAAVLISRIGLYGFTLGEGEIRQRTIPAGQRGEVNGTFSAVTSLVSLALAGSSTVFATPQDFGVMIAASVVAVGSGAALFCFWSRSSAAAQLHLDRVAP